MSRKKARDTVVKILYSADVNEDFSKGFFQKQIESYKDSDLNPQDMELNEDEEEFASSILEGFSNNKDKIDSLISKHLKDWDISRIGRVDLAILRVSVYEIAFREDIPINVIINEAIENAKLYCRDDSYKFINGVLGSVVEEERE
ncbi:MAG: transcription antitermination factor NusB [Tissierellia bacterium]|nr:transcription antitermination factor NusB [Tissierellia bacterium]